MIGALEFRILGPLEVLRDGGVVAIPSAKQRIVLATLLLHANQVVDVDELIDRLWHDDAPAAARGTAQAYVMRLRRRLGDPAEGHRVIRTEQNGYVLAAEPRQLDLDGFRQSIRLAGDAAEQRDQATEAKHLREALALWRGRPLSNVPSDVLHREEIPWLEELRLQALERRLQIDVESGRHAEVIGELQALTVEHPLRERFWANLMLALYRANRQADALDAHRRLVKVLSEELGLEPGEDIRRLRQAILSSDPSLRGPSQTAGRVSSLLPPDVADFVGRQDEIATVSDLLTQRPGRRHLRLVVLSGPPGVGKSALAVHIAHRVREEFPDGQLHVNLQGYSTSPPMTVQRALAHLLRALGIRSEEVPLDPGGQAYLYHSLLGDKRLLIVLDNAGSSDQVRPLLPVNPGCAVLVTSRNELRGLTALQGARRVMLEPLSGPEARLLLAEIVGSDKVAAEPGPSDELVRLCAQLPLAVRIAAANLSSRPRAGIADYVSALRRANRLSMLSIEDDEQAAVLTAFGLSYETLEPEARRVFRMLGLVPGHDFTSDAVAALAGEPVGALLEGLAAASLVQRDSSDRYQLHDLLRLYARDRAQVEDSTEERTAALHRLYGFYLGAADAAADTLNPALPRLPRPAWLPDAGRPDLADHQEAVRWLAGERPGLVAAVEVAAGDPVLRPLSWHLAEALAGYLHLHRHDGDLLATATAALAAARAEADPLAEATMLNALGVLHWSVGDYPSALDHLRRALDLHQAAEHPAGTSTTLTNLGVVHLEDGQLTDAVRQFSRALEVSRAAGAEANAAVALVRLGGVHLELGRLTAAKDYLHEALATCREQGLLHTEAAALNTLGAVHLRLGEFDQASARHQEALDRYRRLGSRHDQVEVLQNLAAVQRDTRQFTSAVEYGEQALELARQTRNLRFEADSLNTLATARNGLGDREAALAQHGEALTLARRVGYRQGEITALIGLASTRAGLGTFELAVSAASYALDLARSTGFRLREAQALTVLAAAEFDLGRCELAGVRAQQALRLHEGTGNLLGQARCHHLLGQLAGDDPEAARKHLSAAREIHQRLGLVA